MWDLNTICGLGKLFLSSGAPEEIKDVKYLLVNEGLPSWNQFDYINVSALIKWLKTNEMKEFGCKYFGEDVFVYNSMEQSIKHVDGYKQLQFL